MKEGRRIYRVGRKRRGGGGYSTEYPPLFIAQPATSSDTQKTRTKLQPAFGQAS